MFNELLQMKMPGNINGISISTLIALADDVKILATGGTTSNLEKTINLSLDVVEKWMANLGLRLLVTKTKAIMLTTKRVYQSPVFFLESIEFHPKEHIRYLGIELRKKLGFGKHLECAAAKAIKTTFLLARLMPNIGGTKQKKRKLMKSMVRSKLLYAAPAWISA